MFFFLFVRVSFGGLSWLLYRNKFLVHVMHWIVFTTLWKFCVLWAATLNKTLSLIAIWTSDSLSRCCLCNHLPKEDKKILFCCLFCLFVLFFKSSQPQILGVAGFSSCVQSCVEKLQVNSTLKHESFSFVVSPKEHFYTASISLTKKKKKPRITPWN